MRDDLGSPLAPASARPEFVDIHCHGARGFSFDDADRSGVEAAVAPHHREHGTAAVVLSLVSAPLARLVARLRELRDIVTSVPGAVGVHLEGPFLAPGRRGAHDLAALVPPTPLAVRTLLTAGEGVLRQITIALELPGAMDAIDEFVAAGVTVALGHTDADAEVAGRAFDRGARVLTHAFNAMPGLAHRKPGPVGAALDRDHVVIEVIADGHHVAPTLIRTLFAAAPGRVALVTDAMAAAGLGDGEYSLGGLGVQVRNDRPLVAGTDTLAGSTLTMRRAVGIAVAAGVPRAHAVTAATVVPARALGLVVDG